MQVRFLAVDGFNLIRRIFEARQVSQQSDMPQVVEAATLSLAKAVSRHKPTHAAVVLEDHDRTWRHLLYGDYKANRSPTPALLLQSLKLFEESFLTLGVSCCSVKSYEADDVIGTIASVVASRGGIAVILSTDKVYLQLLGDNVKVVDHFNDHNWETGEITQKYGIEVSQYIDYLALTGDSSNNIKGVPGVGPKSAAQLLKDHASLDGVLSANEPDRLALKVLKARVEALKCRQLVTLKTDVELGRNLRSFRL